jgi:hypothetical protein
MIINRTKISYLTLAAQLIMAFSVKVGKKKISNNKNQITNKSQKSNPKSQAPSRQSATKEYKQIPNIKSQTINDKRYFLFTFYRARED